MAASSKTKRAGTSPRSPQQSQVSAEDADLLTAIDRLPDSPPEFQSGQSTSKKAAKILVSKRIGFVVPTGTQRQNLLVAFARRGKVVYGKAFDIVKLAEPVDLNDIEDVERRLAMIIIYEIKSSKRELPNDFSGFFFALTGAEILVAQSLKEQFKFVLVNTQTGAFLEIRLSEMFARAKGIYATWSIRF
jgi:hypothetical protein